MATDKPIDYQESYEFYPSDFQLGQAEKLLDFIIKITGLPADHETTERISAVSRFTPMSRLIATKRLNELMVNPVTSEILLKKIKSNELTLGSAALIYIHPFLVQNKNQLSLKEFRLFLEAEFSETPHWQSYYTKLKNYINPSTVDRLERYSVLIANGKANLILFTSSINKDGSITPISRNVNFEDYIFKTLGIIRPVGSLYGSSTILRNGRHGKVVLNITNEIGWTHIQTQELQKVLLNLINNSIEAKDGANIEITD